MTSTAPETRAAVLAALAARRSVPSAGLIEPGPTGEERATLLTLAARVPDHGMLTPWRFILIEGEARAALGARLAQAYREANGHMPEEKREKFAAIMGRLFPAPLAVVVVSRPVAHASIPLIEQELSAGAVCLNLLNAAHALGYAGIWVTGWAATHGHAVRLLGVGEGERVAGILHIGTAKEPPAERPRPDVAALTTHWAPPDA
ncbi:nitroreductase family protein [Ancylobacter sp. SL191]|uniref:nitroreductase family protein n=1 Tax=Ancylobacter sp. SL191 TaxID=2995166 RepID=UPI00226E3C9B|nr:nitroreductase [Ancylobacter sp. SL191]WAC27195.1 nitroreductase [Ancylobacter sp. SL191]